MIRLSEKPETMYHYSMYAGEDSMNVLHLIQLADQCNAFPDPLNSVFYSYQSLLRGTSALNVHFQQVFR